MIKMIAADMDGTLLNGKREISKENCEAIHAAQQAGIEFVIATGRSLGSAMPVLENYDFKCTYILASGGEIRDEQLELKKRECMKYEKIKEIVDLCEKYPVQIHFCGAEHDYAVGSEEEVQEAICRELSSFTGIPMEKIPETMLNERMNSHIIRLDTMEEVREYNIYKAFIFSDDVAMLDKLNAEIIELGGIASASSFPTNIEITDIRAQKGIALEALALKKNIQLSEIMAVGDSLNDESMLSLPLGASVVMENGHERLKEICSHMTKSNDEDGVAYAIYKAMDGTLDELKNPVVRK